MDESRLDGIPLFAGLTEPQRRKLAGEMREVKLAQGDHLVDEGEFPLDFFVICEGSAAVVSRGKHLTDLGPGDFLGEIGLLQEALRTASVIATSPIAALAIPARVFREMTSSMPEASHQIEAAMQERLERDRQLGFSR